MFMTVKFLLNHLHLCMNVEYALYRHILCIIAIMEVDKS